MTPDKKATGNADEAAQDERIKEQVYAGARAIPAGRVISYGALGARCTPPISGYICGRIMNIVPEGVPWWRVVAKDGSLPIGKRNPLLSRQQREHLEDEGVGFTSDDKIDMAKFAEV